MAPKPTATPTPTPSICPSILYQDAKGAIRQLTEAFGFTEHAVYEDDEGRVVHAELSHGNGMVMLGSRGTGGKFDELMAVGGPTGVFVHVDDVDAHYAQAVEHRADVMSSPTDREYGARDYLVRDREGNVWSFGSYRPGVTEPPAG
ncbi:VOC family protein [Streptomyces sp. NPDC059076]|uniref:VOC family protein n=1 Tax=unclassified Streptomyces TaxID=2593676 RepID=UPI003693DF75